MRRPEILSDVNLFSNKTRRRLGLVDWEQSRLRRVLRPSLAVSLGLLAAAGCRSFDPKSAGARPPAPRAQIIPGDLPVSGIRYWKAPFQKLPLQGCYVSVLTNVKADGHREYEMWQNTWGAGGATNRCLIVSRGPSLTQLADDGPVFNGTLITDVPDPQNPMQASARRGLTRPFMIRDPEFGYVLLACVCPDYQAPLLPAILVSKTGQAGTFQYLGKLKGEPAIEAANRSIWSDGGSLFRLPNGRWRIYLNGYGPVLAALESATLDGEWKFIREGTSIRELLPDFQTAANAGGCFPTVLRVAEDNWQLWISDKWEPQSIWHYWSADGLSWQRFGQQPEITRAAFNGRVIKCLRAYLDPDSREIVGLLSVWDDGSKTESQWTLFVSRMVAAKPRNLLK